MAGVMSRRNSGIKAALCQGLNEYPHLFRRIQLCYNACGAHHEVQVGLDIQAGLLMALDECVLHQFGDRFFGQGSAVNGVGEDLFTGLGKPDVSRHLHGLVDNVGLACNQVRSGEDTFGSGIAYLDRGYDVVGFGAKIWR